MKDKRYDSVGKLIRSNQIKTFEEILIVIPKTRMALDLGIGSIRFNKLIESTEMFVLKDLYHLAELFEVDTIAVLHLINNQYHQDKKRKNKKAIKG